MRAVVLVGGLRHPPAAAHRPPTQADAACRRPADDRVGRRLAGCPWRRRRRAVPRVSTRRVRGGVSRRPMRWRPAALRGRTRAPRHRRGHPVRGARRWNRRTVRRPERRRAERRRPRGARGLPRTRRGRGHHLAAPGRRSVRVRCRAHARRRAGARLRREAAPWARPRPTSSTPARTCSSRLSSTASRAERRVSVERETFPAMVADGVLFAVPTATSTGSTPARLPSTSRPSSTSSTVCGAGCRRRSPRRAIVAGLRRWSTRWS